MAELKDSGTRREWANGAVRDMADGKGRCDLMPLAVVANLTDSDVLHHLDSFKAKPDRGDYIENAIKAFIFERKWDICTASLETAIHFEDGARKYSPNNWHGLPLSCFIDSGIRHYLKYKRGDVDEPHDRAFLWNMMCALWILDNRPDQCDMEEDV